MAVLHQLDRTKEFNNFILRFYTTVIKVVVTTLA